MGKINEFVTGRDSSVYEFKLNIISKARARDKCYRLVQTIISFLKSPNIKLVRGTQKRVASYKKLHQKNS